MKKLANFSKHLRSSMTPADESSSMDIEIISLEQAQQFRGGDKDYMPIYETPEKVDRYQPSIILSYNI